MVTGHDFVQALGGFACSRCGQPARSESGYLVWTSATTTTCSVGLLSRIADTRDAITSIMKRGADVLLDDEEREACRSALARLRGRYIDPTGVERFPDHVATEAREEVQRLIAKASEVPGLSATVDELRHEALTSYERGVAEGLRRSEQVVCTLHGPYTPGCRECGADIGRQHGVAEGRRQMADGLISIAARLVHIVGPEGTELIDREPVIEVANALKRWADAARKGGG